MLPEEKKQIATLNDKLMRTIDIRLTTSRDVRSQALKTFGRELVENAPKIRMVCEKDDEADALPGLHIASSIAYHAVPHGTELLPFLDTLADISERREENAQIGPVQVLQLPARLKLYMSSMCTFCPAVVRKLLPLALQNTSIRLAVIDVFLFPEMADTDHIRSVPTLILDDQFRWTGTVDLNEVLNTIQRRDPTQLSAETLASMISDGNAYGLSEMMLKEECIFPGFIDLLTHEAFSIRLGAMAAAEEIAESRISLAVQMAALLAERFEQQSDAVKGDILYIIGASGDDRSLDFLGKISTGEYSKDVKEAAAEALEEIRSR
ncbi:thioredoxin family protein [Thermodesulfobacteriota bacterium]